MHFVLLYASVYYYATSSFLSAEGTHVQFHRAAPPFELPPHAWRKSLRLFFFFWRRCPTRRKSKILTILYKKREISTKIVRYKVHLWPGISASSLNFVTIVRVFLFVCVLGDTTIRGGLNQLHEKRKSSSTRVWGSHLDRC